MGGVGSAEHDGGIRVLRGVFNVLGYVVNEDYPYVRQQAVLHHEECMYYE